MGQYRTDIENINLSIVPFANDIIPMVDNARFEVFKTVENGAVDLSKVIGGSRWTYIDMSWGQLKPVSQKSVKENILQRAHHNLRELRQHPEYYLTAVKKRDWEFYELNDAFIIETGMHRTVISRFFFFINSLPPVVQGVAVKRVKIRCT